MAEQPSLYQEGLGSGPSCGVLTNETEFVFYERLSNEYRRSFVQWKWKLCDGLLSDPYIGQMLVRGGLKNLSCPFQEGEYHLMNLTVDMRSFKNVWPFEKSRLSITSLATDKNNTLIGNGEVYLTIKEERRSKSSKKNRIERT
ncbi:hypothetical protein EVAR_19018_1 [Eumeta japonica]|uniref:Uncharacterized protein n=1 Tax=Eumeta variegata TaxID=151549 RepID=A0A4C1V8I7_EUMVA|nr:hypothetical protein EVAR_19018_1 [Eumeta japonica]